MTALLVTAVVTLVALVLLLRPNLWLRFSMMLWAASPVGIVAWLLSSVPIAYLNQAVGTPFSWRDGRFMARQPLVRWIIGVALLYLVGMLWAVDSRLALRTAISVVLLAAAIVCTYGICKSSVDALGHVFAWVAPVVLAQALSVFVMAARADFKTSYYGSSAARFLLGDSGQQAVDGNLVVNALYADKAAGIFFLNANRASMVMGVIAIGYLAYSIYARRRWPVLVAAIIFAAVFAAGSKTGDAIAIGFPFVAWTLARFSNRALGTGRLVALPAGALFALGAPVVAATAAAGFVAKSQVSLRPRLGLWSHAWHASVDTPLTGWAVGGWEDRWPHIAPSLGLSPTFPPHNFLLYAGTQGGVPMMVAQFACIASMFLFAIRGLTSLTDRRDRLTLIVASYIPIWIFVHGMGDNTLFYGVSSSIPAVALSMTLCQMVRNRADVRADPSARESAPVADAEGSAKSKVSAN